MPQIVQPIKRALNNFTRLPQHIRRGTRAVCSRLSPRRRKVTGPVCPLCHEPIKTGMRVSFIAPPVGAKKRPEFLAITNATDDLRLWLACARAQCPQMDGSRRKADGVWKGDLGDLKNTVRIHERTSDPERFALLTGCSEVRGGRRAKHVQLR